MAKYKVFEDVVIHKVYIYEADNADDALDMYESCMKAAEEYGIGDEATCVGVKRIEE